MCLFTFPMNRCDTKESENVISIGRLGSRVKDFYANLCFDKVKGILKSRRHCYRVSVCITNLIM